MYVYNFNSEDKRARTFIYNRGVTTVSCTRQLSFIIILLGAYFCFNTYERDFVLYKAISCGYQVSSVIKKKERKVIPLQSWCCPEGG